MEYYVHSRAHCCRCRHKNRFKIPLIIVKYVYFFSYIPCISILSHTQTHMLYLYLYLVVIWCVCFYNAWFFYCISNWFYRINQLTLGFCSLWQPQTHRQRPFKQRKPKSMCKQRWTCELSPLRSQSTRSIHVNRSKLLKNTPYKPFDGRGFFSVCDTDSMCVSCLQTL